MHKGAAKVMDGIFGALRTTALLLELPLQVEPLP